MLLFLIMLDSDEDRSKFVQLYHKYRYFCGIWHVKGYMMTIWQKMQYRKHF